MMSKKQRLVMEFCAAHGSITLQQAVKLIGGDVYANQSKHCGALLSNMVKRGFIVRKHRGVFEIAPRIEVEVTQPVQLEGPFTLT